MQSFENNLRFTNLLGTSSAVVITIIIIYFLMSILEMEDSNNNRIPLVGLSCCSIVFSLIELLFVYNPSWLGANSISWFWIGGFTVFWAIGSASLEILKVLCYSLGYYSLLQSQYSTDNRALWLKFMSEFSSVAITVISLFAGISLLFGSKCGMKLLESYSQFYTFLILLCFALAGLCLGNMLNTTIKIVIH